MPKGDLETLLKKARQADPVPDFRKTWSRAQAMQSPRTKPAVFRPRVLVPVGATAVVAVLLAVGMQRADRTPVEQQTATYQVDLKNRTEIVAELGDMEPWSGELDGLGTEWTFGLTVSDSSDDDGIDMSFVAVSNNISANDLYESPTDFLLDLDVPTWNQAVERNVL